MSFRPATTEDEALFWRWRKADEGQAWYGGQGTRREHHGEWFRDRLGKVTLLVWLHKDRPAGIARIDSNGEVAFSASTALMPLLAEELRPWSTQYGGRLKVTVDWDDQRRANALSAAGFSEYPVRFFCFRP